MEPLVTSSCIIHIKDLPFAPADLSVQTYYPISEEVDNVNKLVQVAIQVPVKDSLDVRNLNKEENTVRTAVNNYTAQKIKNFQAKEEDTV